MTDTVIVAGSVVQRAAFGGHAWAFAQHVRGLRALGAQVVFVDRLVEDGWDVAEATPVLDLLGGPSGVCVLGPDGESRYGMDRSELLVFAGRADLLVNVMGFIDDPAVFEAPGRRVFLDVDPGFGQMWRELGLADVFAGHDTFVTVGTGIVGSQVPTCGLEWVTIPPPVFLPDWPVTPPRPDAAVTSVSSWRGPFGPIEYEGTTYGLRVHEFRRFLELPRRTTQRLEVALDIAPADERDRATLLEHGWLLVDPRTVAGSPESYRRYVAASKAELMIAKHLYVATRGGWFSDRSSCYLASGRPVVAQDTGFGTLLPCGDGLLTFTDPEDAVLALLDMDHRYLDHCEAARAIAEDHLSTEVVLPRLLDAATR